jgi:hypothetical protein
MILITVWDILCVINISNKRMYSRLQMLIAYTPIPNALTQFSGNN